jgi:acylphosphatase
LTQAEANLRLHALIEGGVQGVGFRYFVLEICQSNDISGWVRNRWDGSVEVTAEGTRPQLDKLLSALYRGPRSADVRGVRPTWSPATGEFVGFTIRPTSD